MSKKYYADINLYFAELKYSIVGDLGTKKQEIVDLLDNFAKNKKLTCNKKSRKFFDLEGKEVGEYEIKSREI